MKIMNKKDALFTNDTCCECNSREDVKILEINGNFLELCANCREILIQEIKNIRKEGI